MYTIMKVNTKTGEVMEQYKAKDPKEFAMKLALALVSSRAEDINEFEFFDAKGLPLHAIDVGGDMILVYEAKAA